MYASGFSIWLLKNFFQIDQGMGLEPRTQQIWIVRIHGTLSFIVVMLLGYVLHAHIMPNWRLRHKIISGLALSSHFLLILLTAPLLLYSTSENLKILFEQTHAYLGLLLIITFSVHRITKK